MGPHMTLHHVSSGRGLIQRVDKANRHVPNKQQHMRIWCEQLSHAMAEALYSQWACVGTWALH